MKKKINIKEDSELREHLITAFVFLIVSIIVGCFINSWIIFIVEIIALITIFGLSIKHLYKYSNGKGFAITAAITALVISTIVLILGVIVFLIGFVIGIIRSI